MFSLQEWVQIVNKQLTLEKVNRVSSLGMFVKIQNVHKWLDSFGSAAEFFALNFEFSRF